MNTADAGPRSPWSQIALAGVVGVVVAGTTVVGVVATRHGSGDPSAPVPSAPPSTARIIPIPVVPTDVPTMEVAAAPRVVRRHP
jgi:hypothetical protein